VSVSILIQMDFRKFKFIRNSAKENGSAPSVDSENVLKAHKIVETLITEFTTIFEEAGTRSALPEAVNLRTQFAEQLRSSALLLQTEYGVDI